MEQEQIVLCDTSVIIDYYNGNTSIIEALDNIGFNNIAISFVVYGEAIYGALNKKDMQRWVKFLDKLIIIPMNEEIAGLSTELLKKYVLSHKLHFADAMIASTAIYYNLPLFTLNINDFRFIKNLQLLKE
jgi:predicted nucleic acid-binding protein